MAKNYVGLTKRFRDAYFDRFPSGKVRALAKDRFCDVFGMAPDTFKTKLSATGDRTGFADVHCKWMEQTDPLELLRDAKPN